MENVENKEKEGDVDALLNLFLFKNASGYIICYPLLLHSSTLSLAVALVTLIWSCSALSTINLRVLDETL